MAGNIITGKINIDGSGAAKDIKIVIQGLDRLEAAIEKLSQVLESFSARLDKVSVSTRKFSSSASRVPKDLSNAGSAAGKAKTDFTGLNRVIQDLPFGFIAISNNLQQLFPAAGLVGLAFSGLVSAITFSQMGLRGWVRSSKEAEKAAEDAAKKQEELQRAFEAAAAAVVGQADKIKDLRTLLVSTAQDVNTLTESITKQALAQFLFTSKEKTVQDAITRALEQQFKTEKQISDFRTKQFKPEDFRRRVNPNVNSEADFNDPFATLKIETGLQTQLRKQSEAAKKANEDTKQQINSINDIAERLGLNFAQFVDKAKKAKDPLDEIIDRAKKISDYLDANTNRVFNFNVDPRLSKSDNAKAAKEFLDKLVVDLENVSRTGLRAFRFKINVSTILDQVTIANATKLSDAISKEALKTSELLRKTVEQDAEKNPVRFRIDVDRKEGEKRFAEFFRALGLSNIAKDSSSLLTDTQKEIINTANLVDSILTPSFEGFFDALLDGGRGFDGFFDGLKNAIKSIVRDVGVAILKALVLKGILSAFGDGSGTSFFDIFKGILGFRAAGGPVTAGGSYIVGEKGPELFTPNVGGRIVSNSDMNRGSVGSFAMQPLQISGRLVAQGNDLVAVLAATNRSQNRLT